MTAVNKIKSFFTSKMSKKTLFSVAVALIILAVVAVNVLFAFLAEKNTFFLDMTSEELYTVSDEMEKQMEEIKGDVKITFCADPDILLANYETRYVYIMALSLAGKYDNIEVEVLDTIDNPALADQYKATSASTIEPYDVIFSSGSRYRIIKAAGFWSVADGEYWAFNGEYKAANAMLSLTSIENPLICFTTGHGEQYYHPTDSSRSNEEYREFYSLLELAGCKIEYVNLDTEDIPEDCVMLVMNGPTVDYAPAPGSQSNVNAASAIEKIDRFLSQNKSLIISKDPFVTLPGINAYLAEWGMKFNDDIVKYSNTEMSGDAKELLFAEYASEEVDAIGHSMYSDVASLASAPKTQMKKSGSIDLLWYDKVNGAGDKYISSGLSVMASAVLRSTKDTLTADENGYTIGKDSYGDLVSDAKEYGNYVLAGISVRSRFVGVNYYYSYIFASATTEMFKNSVLESNALANNDILFSTVRTMTRTEKYAADELGAVNLNTDKYGGKILDQKKLYEEEKEVWDDGELVAKYSGLSKGAIYTWTALFILVPLAGTVTVGVIVTVKRKKNM